MLQESLIAFFALSATDRIENAVYNNSLLPQERLYQNAA
jgi:hypothetical protein